MKLTKETLDMLAAAPRDERIYACAKSFKLYSTVYFSHYLRYRSPPFHDTFYQDFEDLVYGRIKDAAWVAYRESAKSSIAANMGLSWIASRKRVIDALEAAGENVDHWGARRYVNVDCFDKANSENILFDLATELQSNELLIADFGNLYNTPRTKEQKDLKRIDKFNTTSGVRFEAHTSMTSTRGRKVGTERPDFILRDDIENEKTIRSPADTDRIISLLDEARAGLPDYAATLTLGNYLSESGSIAYVMKLVRGSGGPVRFIPELDPDRPNGKVPTWPDKYVITDAQAAEANKEISDPKRQKISLQSKKRTLNAGGRRVYEVEMMLDPVAAGSPFFDRTIIERLIGNATDPVANKAEFLTWATYKPGHRYAIGADTAKGNGGDHNTSVTIDFSVIPAQQVGSYAKNEIAPDLFAHELKREADIFGTCLIAPEKNTESGGTCLTTLKMIYPVEWIYQTLPFDKTADKPSSRNPELGWETNASTKYTILYELKTDVEDGQLVINDVRILKEMRSFTHSAADELAKTRVGHFTNHFDLLMAAAIANYVGKRHARVHQASMADYVQPEAETPGLS